MRTLSITEQENIAGGYRAVVYPLCYDTWEPVVTTEQYVTPVFDHYGFYLYDAVDVVERVDYFPVTVCY